MPITKTNFLLPTVFQTDSNKKFLNATLDQLVTEPNLKPINGYIGRKFAPGFQGIDTYIREPSELRADYQLEPSVIYKNQSTNEVEYASTYAEVLQKINYYGGQIENQNNLWSSQYYTYNPQINLDKFINFSQYYWLPNGPDSVTVSAGAPDLSQLYTVNRDANTKIYNIFGYGAVQNPELVLVRGGTYQFEVNQAGHPFYIQTDPGLSGKQLSNTNLSSRAVYGVANNGDDQGIITFVVPATTAQDFYVNMPVTAIVDLVTTLSYAQIQGQLLSTLTSSYNGIDGQYVNLDNKLIIFGQYYANASDWTSGATTVPLSQRTGIWKINQTPTGNDYTITLTYYGSIPVNNKVNVQSGIAYGNTQWYHTVSDRLEQLPVITADLEYLYYQDGVDATAYGRIRLTDSNSYSIDVNKDILGKNNYISPNGVVFSNGLKIKFDTTVTPSSYQNKEFYVEGVGESIVLIDVDSLVITQTLKTAYDPEQNFVLAANAVLSAGNNLLTITTTDVPNGSNVLVGTFPNVSATNYITPQNSILSYPYRGGTNTAGEHEAVTLRQGPIGITMPGIYIFGPSNQWYIPVNSDTVFHYNSPAVKINGQDVYNGTVSKKGEYFYQDSTFIQQNAWPGVQGFTSGWTHDDGHSKIIGFAADGYPIYGPYGYDNPLDNTTSIVKMTSSYQLGLAESRPAAITSTVTETSNGNIVALSSTVGINPGMRITVNSAGITSQSFYVLDCSNRTALGLDSYPYGQNTVLLNGNVTVTPGDTLQFEFLPGAFIEDYFYMSGSGTLDQYNGRYCVTPDFPNGTYAYFCSLDSLNNPSYPYIIGSAFYGSLIPDQDISLDDPDYITINLASRDVNPWTRRNRWFHQSIIEATANYNNLPIILDQNNRAKRPIIEFNPNLQLFNFGKVAIPLVDLYDTQFKEPMSQIEGKQNINVDGVNLVEGLRLVFASATNSDIRNKVYLVQLVNPSGSQEVIHLLPQETVVENNTINVKYGSVNQNKSFYFNGMNWLPGQQKTALNQFPLYDVIDTDDISFGSRTKYPVANNETKFIGTKIFNYKISDSSVTDPILNLALSYKSINNIGDIEFYNYFDNEQFSYIKDAVRYTKKLNTGYFYRNNVDGTITKLNVWSPVSYDSRQFQIFSYTYDGINNVFNIDVTPKVSVNVPNIRVFVNYDQLSVTDFQIYYISTNSYTIQIKQNKLTTDARVNILVNSDQSSRFGFYQVPDNLNYNSKNEILQSVTLGSLRNHIEAVTQNSTNFSGVFPGDSNLRDLNIVSQGGTILQQSAPTVYSSLFLNNNQFDFVNSVINSQQEYTRFKNKFLTIAGSNATIDPNDPVTAVDIILQQINQIKDNTFAWYYSDQVPYGDNKNTLSYTVFDIFQRTFEITEIFSLDQPNNQAVILYLNGIQLIYGKDYEFITTAPAVRILDSVTLAVDDIITIVEYNDTDGCFVPETPTKLGLYPKFLPQIITDTSYLTPQQFIQGHDGSLTPVFNDFRDDVLLEYEKRVYNNIKVQYDYRTVNIYDVIPGKFRDTGYSLREYNNVISKYYLQWIGLNNLNFTTNSIYDSANPFTFNYNQSRDTINGELLQGSWRACFEYFYDTQTPNTTPWEMLGFSEKPDWWEATYGPAPYTSGNTILWQDLANGYIAAGDRQGVDTRFARPQLLNIIPVDQNGNLQSPFGLLTTNTDESSFNNPWNVGQLSPWELAWRTSSEYPYAVQIAMALMMPAKYFSFGIVTNKYRFDDTLDQYLVSNTNFRLQPTDIEINGYTDPSGNISRAAGYLNWISEFQTSRGIISKQPLLDFVQKFDVKLAYRAAGFTSKQYIKVLAEQFSPNSINDSIIVPDSDFDVVLHKSGQLANPKYSGVIIEKTSTGFVVTGYDTKNPYFILRAPNINGAFESVPVLKTEVNWYTEFNNYLLNISYGTKFETMQQIASFLSGYQQYLIESGFTFDQFDENLEKIKDWKLSVQEFLFWAQQGWGNGSILVLSPISKDINFTVSNAVVDAVLGSYYGNRVSNQNFLTLEPDAYTVVRDNTSFKLTLDSSSSDLLGLADFNLVQYEHLIIFNNTTQFNDVIYEPASGARQFRLKLVGLKTADWNGTLSASGFMYSTRKVDTWAINTDYLRGDLVEYKNLYYIASNNVNGSTKFNFNEWLPVNKNLLRDGLIRNFATNANVFDDFYDVNKINLEDQFDLFSLGLIGYRNREYLNQVGLDDTSQVKFYQGFIKEKGTLNSVKAVENIRIANESKEINLNEEWAFRVGSYGNLENNQFIELNLDEDYVLSNPTSIQVNTNNSVTYNSLNTVNNEIFKTAVYPWQYPIYLNRTSDSVYTDDIQTAGYVNIEDVNFTVFDLNSPTAAESNTVDVGVGAIIWVAKDYNQDWNVYRVNRVLNDARVINIDQELGSYYVVTTDRQHGLTDNDTVIINSEFSDLSALNGYYKVIQTLGLNQFAIESITNLDNIVNINFTDRSLSLLKLDSVKLNYTAELLNLPNQWIPQDKVWINENDSNKNWAVYEKSEPWVSNLSLSITLDEANARLGSSISITSDNTFLAIGQPGLNSNKGSVSTFLVDFAGNISENLVLAGSANSTANLGASVTAANIFFAAGAPDSYSGSGYVYVYEKNFLGAVNLKQILSANTYSAVKFGTSIAMSNDDQWLYVGAPEEDKVYVYQLNDDLGIEVDTITTDGVTATYTLGFTANSADVLYVSNVSTSVSRILVPYKDFDVAGNQFTFKQIPAAGTAIVRQYPNYILRNTIAVPGATISTTPNVRFGFSVSCSTDGRQLVVGAPYANASINSTTYSRSGKTFVYDRSVENFIANGTSNTFVTTYTVTDLSAVLVNGILQSNTTVISSNSIQLSTTPTAGSLVTIETNQFNLLEELTAATPQAHSHFGHSVDICNTSCSIYVGEPDRNDLQNLAYRSGAVTAFTNQGRLYGTIQGTANATVTIGDSIRINDFVVTFTGTNLTSVINSINSADIPGVTASNVNYKLEITSNSLINTDKLRILPAVGTAIDDLGLNVFVNTQTITEPYNSPYSYFGQKVRVAENSLNVSVSSTDASTAQATTFDRNLLLDTIPANEIENLTDVQIEEIKNESQTTFDSASTTFTDYVTGSGSVWVYQYLTDSRNDIEHPGKLSFIQQLYPRSAAGTGVLETGIKFGADVLMTNQFALVGAIDDTITEEKSGVVYNFVNPDNLYGWDIIRYQEPKVDISSINKNYIYSVRGSNIIDFLDYIDPAKGKILGIAEQDITYKTDYDPAVYNNGTSSTVAIDEKLHWSEQEVGQVWWDLGALRYIDYEQGSIKYRTSNWGRTFPGSSVDVYEWTESLYPPSQYVLNGGEGEPKYLNNTYSTISYVDPGTNTTVVKFYYWVKNKNSLGKFSNRSLPVLTIANYIQDPKSSGIKFLAAIRNDSVAVYNSNQNLSSKDRVLHLDYFTKINESAIHNEYQLVSEKAKNVNQIPNNIYSKIKDSLSRIDIGGNQVPDPYLPPQIKYGIEIRPRQSIFVDQNNAVKQLVLYVNSVFKNYIMSQGFNLDTLESGESLPAAGSGQFDLSVETYDQLQYLNIAIYPVGYKVLVESDSNAAGLWTIYVKKSDETWLLYKVQSYDTTEYWEYTDWYAEGFNASIKPNYTVENYADLGKLNFKSEDIIKIKNTGQGNWSIVQVWPTFVTTIGLQNGTIKLKNSLYDLENNFMGFSNERFSTDRFDHNPSLEIRKILEALQNNLFINQLSQEFVNLFFILIKYALNEQKSLDWVFKTSFVTIDSIVEGLRQPQIYSKENQGLYESYINEIKPYRTTIREFIQGYNGVDNFNGYISDFDLPAQLDTELNVYRSPNGDYSHDAQLFQDPQYFDWLSNYTYYVQNIVIAQNGSGYTTAPTVTITGSQIGDNARATAYITDGVISKIEVTYPGSNYVTQPTITISGGNGTGATAYARLSNDLIRKIKTTLVYDRVTYGSNVSLWQANTVYSKGQIVAYNNKAYIVDRNFTSGAFFLGNDLTEYSAANFETANDRIQSYYQDTDSYLGKNFALLQTGIEYPGVTVEGLKFKVTGGLDVMAFDGAPFDPVEEDDQGNPVVPSALVDTIIESEYSDSDLTTRPGAIIVDGSDYVNQYSSYAPEELVPGRAFDTLDMKVVTFATNAAATAYSTWITDTAFFVSNIEVIDSGIGYDSNATVVISGTTGANATANLTLDSNGSITAVNIITAGDKFSTVPNITVLGSNTSPAVLSVKLSQNTYDTFEYRIFKDKNGNYQYLRIDNSTLTTVASNVTVTSNVIIVANSQVLPAPDPNSSVICSITINGERIIYRSKDDDTNTLGQLIRGAYGTGATEHIAGDEVIDTSYTQIIPKSATYYWTPNANSVVVTASGDSISFAGNVTYTRSNAWIELLDLTYLTTEDYIVLATEAGDVITTEEQDNLESHGLYTSQLTPAVFIRQD